ncbi:MAG TPA: glycosyltransferase family 4 protein [Bellilinea sp.]|nr:glycosyltransferase family 4 protein [Bellilinea sp.]
MTDALTIYAPGHFDPYDSYGMIACELVRHLDALGVWVNAMGLGDRVVDTQPDDVRAVTSRPIRPTLGGILLGYPTGYHRYGPLAAHGLRIAVTMFESTRLPPGWAESLNTCDAVVVPSRWLVDVFREHGVTAPLHVVPLGLDEVFQPAARPSNREPFTFLTLRDRGRRKGGIWAEQAFVRAFGDDPGVRLIEKARDPKAFGIQATNENIDIIQRDMTPGELYELYLSCDALVNPNMGEGFGLVPREFAATGGITLATDWGGTADDISVWGIPLPHGMTRADYQARNLAGYDLGEWAMPDLDALAHIMRDVVEHREAYQTRAETNAPRVRAMYSWRRFAEGVLNIWREAVHGYSYAAGAPAR